MSLSAIIDALIASGGTLEQVAAIVRAHEAATKIEPARSPAAIRQARYRERKASQNVTRDVTHNAGDGCDDRVSSPVPKETSPLHPPKEITLIPTIPTSEERATSKRGCRLPADWQPSQPEVDFAAKEGMSREAISREAEKFRDYWASRAGAGGVKLDWGATWRNWIRNNASNGTSHGQRNQQQGLFSSNRGGPREDPLITAARREIDGIRGSGWG